MSDMTSEQLSSELRERIGAAAEELEAILLSVFRLITLTKPEEEVEETMQRASKRIVSLLEEIL